MANYLINESTLTATADKIRDCLKQTKFSFDPGIVNTDGTIDPGTIYVYYQEWIDNGENYQGIQEGAMGTDEFIAYDFLENNDGAIVPVLFKTDIYGDEPETPDYVDPFFYEGKVEIDGILFDKWRKIDDELTWDTTSKKYVYTDVVVIDNKICPTDFPDKIEEIYLTGAADKITDLAGTTWCFIDQIPIQDYAYYDVNFYAGSFNDGSIERNGLTLSNTTIKYGTTTVALSGTGYYAWENDQYRTITFTDGDTTNVNLINFVLNSATQEKTKSKNYQQGYMDAFYHYTPLAIQKGIGSPTLTHSSGEKVYGISKFTNYVGNNYYDYKKKLVYKLVESASRLTYEITNNNEGLTVYLKSTLTFTTNNLATDGGTQTAEKDFILAPGETVTHSTMLLGELKTHDGTVTGLKFVETPK